MTSNPITTTLEFADSRLSLPLEPFDPLEQIALADRADWLLLRLVLCTATATLLLALASSLGR